MEGLVKKGLTKSIGVSNYNVQALVDVLSYCEIKPAVNQVEFHPYLHQTGLLEFCNLHGVRVVAYNSLCRGKYTTILHKEGTKNLLEEPVVIETAKKYGKSAAQIALNWALAQGLIVIPSSSKTERMKENLQSDTFVMSKDDIENIGKLNHAYRFVTGDMLSALIPGLKGDIFA